MPGLYTNFYIEKLDNKGNIEDMYNPFIDRGICIKNKTKKKVS